MDRFLLEFGPVAEVIVYLESSGIWILERGFSALADGSVSY